MQENIFCLVLFRLLELMKDYVNDDAKNKRASDRGDNDLADSHGHTADTGDENNRYGEEVCVILEVNLLDHLKAGNRDEAVEGDTNAAHYASGNGIKEGYKGRYEGYENRKDSSRGDGCYGCVTRDRYTAYRLTVGGVGTAAEECANHRAYAVTEKGVVKTGILKKVMVNDGGEILVVCDMLRENNESNGDICNCDGCKIAPLKVTEALERINEGKFGDGEEGLDGNAVCNKVLEGSEVNDLHSVNACDIADYGEHKSYRIAGEDTNDEGDELGHLLTVGRAENNYNECNNRTDEREPEIGAHNERAVAVLGTVGEYVLNSRACERKTDERNGGTDNYRGHELVDPFNANKLDHNRDCYVNETCKDRADKDSEVAEAHRGSACEGCAHRADEGEGRAEEHRTAELGEELINDCAYARAEKRCGCGHTVTYDCGHGDGCGDDRQELLNGKDDKLGEFRSVVDAIDKIVFHFFLLFFN